MLSGGAHLAPAGTVRAGTGPRAARAGGWIVVLDTWDGRRVLVTGASSGIGAAFARELASAGAVVGLCARRTELLDAVLADCQASVPACRSWTMDLSDLDALGGFVAQVEDELGGIDVLVNNAALVKGGDAMTTPWETVEYMTRLNYLSPVRLTHEVLPAMLDRGDGQVVTVSSMAARMSTPGESAYSGAKAALSGYFESLAGEVWGKGVTFHMVYPGLIEVKTGLDGDDALAASPDPRTRVPAPVLAREMRRQVEQGTFELYVPYLMKEQFENRAADVGASVERMARWWGSGASR